MAIIRPGTLRWRTLHPGNSRIVLEWNSNSLNGNLMVPAIHPLNLLSRKKFWWRGTSMRVPGETMSDIGNRLSGLRSSAPSIVEISPPDIARRRLADWGAIQADTVRVTRRETFECGFQARRHLLIAYERAERNDGETLIEGLPKSTLREFNCKLSFVPAGHRFYGWQTPRVLTRVTYFYIDLQDSLFGLEIRHRLSHDQPAPVLLRSSRLGYGAQTQGRGREFRPVEPAICGGLECRADARTHPIGTLAIRPQ